MATAAVQPEQWITPTEARQRLGLPRHRFINVYKSGVLTIQKFPGCRMRFLAADVDRLIEESVRPATASA